MLHLTDNSSQQSGNIAVAENEVPQNNMWFRGIRTSMGRASLRRELSKTIETAKNYEANGLPQGSKQYKQLFDKSCSDVTSFAKKYGVSVDETANEAPSLFILSQLASEPKAKPHASKIGQAIGLVVTLLAAAALFGLMSGISHRLAVFVGGN